MFLTDPQEAGLHAALSGLSDERSRPQNLFTRRSFQGRCVRSFGRVGRMPGIAGTVRNTLFLRLELKTRPTGPEKEARPQPARTKGGWIRSRDVSTSPAQRTRVLSLMISTMMTIIPTMTGGRISGA